MVAKNRVPTSCWTALGSQLEQIKNICSVMLLKVQADFHWWCLAGVFGNSRQWAQLPLTYRVFWNSRQNLADGRINKTQTLVSAEFGGVRVFINIQFNALKGISGPEGFLRFHPVSTGTGHESLEHISHSEQNHVYCPRPRPLLQWSQTSRDASRFNFPPSFYTSDLEESCICVPAATKRPSLIASQWKAETSHFLA